MSKPKAPKPTLGEQQLQQEQAALARQQRDILQQVFAQMQGIQPELLEQLGLQRSALTDLFQESLLAEDDPALLRDLREQEQALNERLRKDLGPGFRSSSPAIEAFGDFSERSVIAKDVARQRSRSESLGISAALGSLIGQELGVIGAPTGIPFPQAQAAFSSALSPLLQQRNIKAQFALQPSPIEALFGSLLGSAGSAAATFGLASAFGFCWVAEVLYGVNDPRTWAIRLYLFNRDNLFTHLYKRYGKTWARWCRYVPVRFIAKLIWDRILRKSGYTR